MISLKENLQPNDFMILLVEDDDVIIEMLKIALKNETFLIEVAKDGEEAKTKFENVRPDLIIVDLMIPKISGYELIRYIRSKYIGKKAPVIVITARRLDDQNIETLKFELNVNEIILKPFPKITLVNTIYNLLNIKWKDQEILDKYKKTDKLIIEK